MLKATVIGNLGAHAVVRNVNGTNAISFSVAHNETYKDSEGVKHEKTIWVNCTYWRTKETALVNYLKKGQMVYVEGTPSVSVYRNKEGISVADFGLRVTEIKLIGSRTDNDEQPTAGQQNGQHQQSPQNGRQQRPQAHANGNGQRRPNNQQPQTTPVDDMEVPEWIQD